MNLELIIAILAIATVAGTISAGIRYFGKGKSKAEDRKGAKKH